MYVGHYVGAGHWRVRPDLAEQLHKPRAAAEGVEIASMMYAMARVDNFGLASGRLIQNVWGFPGVEVQGVRAEGMSSTRACRIVRRFMR